MWPFVEIMLRRTVGRLWASKLSSTMKSTAGTVPQTSCPGSTKSAIRVKHVNSIGDNAGTVVRSDSKIQSLQQDLLTATIEDVRYQCTAASTNQTLRGWPSTNHSKTTSRRNSFGESEALSSSTVVLTGRIRPSKIPRRAVSAAVQAHHPAANSCSSRDNHLPEATSPRKSVSDSPASTAASVEVVSGLLFDPPIPVKPILTSDSSVYPLGFQAIQGYINAFGYNHTSVPFYRMKRTGGTLHLLEIVESISTLALPIQCVEAVFLGAALSSVWSSVDRIPISFKSKFETSSHRHIVLAFHLNGRWGSVGISNIRLCGICWKSFNNLMRVFITNY
jgi:hypothetical protein